MSISWLLDVEPAPALLVLPPAAASLDEAHAAIELWEHYSRKTLDPSQRLTVEVMMAQDASGGWAAATTGREMPRQNGKGDEIEVVELWGLVQRGEAILHTVHDAVLLATQAQQRMLGVLDQPDLRQRIKRKWQGTGQQMIEMRNGGTIWYRTRTGGGGRGVDDIDRLVIDEAQHATEEHLAAVAPTLLANDNPQLNAMGTSGIDGRSDWWWTIRRRALTESPGAFGYVGHTAERVHLDDTGRVHQEPVDVQDRSLWPAANPSIASGRGGGMAFLEEQLLRLGEASFAREHLGVWDAPAEAGGGDVDATAWKSLDVGVEDQRPSKVALSVDMSPDRQWCHIGLAGVRADGRRHLQVVQSFKGTAGVVERVAELVAKWSPVGVAVNPSAPAGSLIAELEDVGVSPVLVSGRQVAQATGMLVDGIDERTVCHGSQPLLDISVAAVRFRRSGDAQVWDHRNPTTDISPLFAVTLALYALSTVKVEKKRRGLVVGMR